MYSIIRLFCLLFFFSFLLPFISCKKYLDVKTDKKLVIPSTLQDAQALLDAYSIYNRGESFCAAASDDDYWLDPLYWNSLSINNMNYYIWHRDAEQIGWADYYQRVLNANVALETVAAIVPTTMNEADWRGVKGTALFYRAVNFLFLLQYYSKPYDATTAANDAGIVLRLSSDASVLSKRATLEKSYAQIIKDLEEAAALLPAPVVIATRPGKATAYGMLARTYLYMRRYEDVLRCADSSLSMYSTLINYNSLSTTVAAPFTRFNEEVLFPLVTQGAAQLNVTNWRADTLLLGMYAQDDLRRSLFFKYNGGNNYGFKGSYDGTTTGSIFCGLTTAEVYLMKAECLARKGEVAAALHTLNGLLETRWKNGFFIPLTAPDVNTALTIILQERRKELVGRGLRWFDLRRLNKEPQFAKTLVRITGGQQYELAPDDKRYTFRIPDNVISLTGMEQNER